MITKSDFLRYLDCPAYYWFFKYKPEVLEKAKLSEFDRQLIENGKEVEQWARKVFHKGALVTSIEENAVIETKKYLEEGYRSLLQATFQHEGLYAMVDILEWDEKNQYWIINEVKASTAEKENKKNKSHLYDATFQYALLKKAGYPIGKVNLVELDKEFRKDGEIDPNKLITFTDITESVKELEPDIQPMIEDMKRILEQKSEPQPCECLYKSRNNHCPTFEYLYPDVPAYSVHNIVGIGKSPKRLEAIIEGGFIKIDEIPEDIELSPTQQMHVNVEQAQSPYIDSSGIAESLDQVEFPLYFLDYETYPKAVPIYDGCSPYQQIPFQYSLHILENPNAEPIHHEYLHRDKSNPMESLAKSLVKVMGHEGSIVVWNESFEKKCNEGIAELLPQYAEAFYDYNQRLYDLMKIFQSQLYLHPDSRGSYSIKKVLPVLAPELSYKELNVQNGSMAMQGWKRMIFESNDETEKAQLSEDLLKYCALDTLAMVEIYKKLQKLT